MLKVGAKVKHRSRPDVGVGELVELSADNTCTVQFPSCKFSGIPIDAIATVEQLEMERRAAEARLRKKQTTIEHPIARKNDAIERPQETFQQIKRKEEDEIRARRAIFLQFAQRGVQSLWYITHKDNVHGILRHGILNHYDAHRLNPNCADISDPGAQRWRDAIEPHYERRIHEYAPLYIKPRNPMLYVRRSLRNELCLLEVSLAVMFENQYLITDGNAASRDTRFFKSVANFDDLPWTVLESGYWTDHLDGRRKMCAEVLIYPSVDPRHIQSVHCYSVTMRNSLDTLGRKLKISRNLFF